MIPEIGQVALILALILSLVQTGAGLVGAWRGDARLMAMGRAASLAQAAFIVVAFCALAACYGLNDYSVALVAEHSNRAQPLVYRLGATWGSHEGSMLLWVLILAIYGGAVAVFGHTLRESLQARVLAIQGLVGAAFLGFMLFTSNPFLRLFPTPPDGAELNPVLQDPGLIFHPPVLYLGYVGFSMAFSFGVAALLEGRVDGAWARWVRPWVLAAWIWLTIGIAAGSIWAYYTLGWGGWWFWDPVENASLMPWLIGTALLHSSLVLERRGALISWTILLSILTFSMSLVGTFLVRSGVLTSVHAFALDARRGVYILGIIAALTGSALVLFAVRAPAFRSGAIFTTVSREFAVMMNNVLLVGATASVFFGTFYPVFLDVLHGDKISVGPPYFQATFGPIFMILLTLVSFGPLLAWRRDGATSVLRQIRTPGLIAIAVLAAGAIAWGPLTGLGLALGVWLIGGAILVLTRRRTLRAIPLAVWGMVLAHAGLGITTLGITGVSSFASDKVLLMAPGETTTLAGRTFALESLRVVEGANYQANQATFRVGGPLGSRELISERRWFPASQSYTTRAGIGASPLGNTYISLGEAGGPGKVIVRLWIHPLVGWIWAGVLTMALGGVLSLADRGLRRVTVTRPRASAAKLGPRAYSGVRHLLFLAPVVLVATVLGVFFLGLGRDPSLLPSTLIGKPVPAFDLAAVRPGGARLTSLDLRGGPRLLNAFASWCVSCRTEHPILLALKAKGVPIDGLDWKDTPAAGGAYLDREGDPYARVGSDPNGRAGIDLGVAAVPETFVVDGAGVVRYKHVGPISPDDWNNTLEPLMARLSAGA